MPSTSSRPATSDTPAIRLPRGYVDPTPVGVGGYSIVYRARHELLDRIVAVKVLFLRDHTDVDVARFTRECRVLAALSGEARLLTVHDAGVTDEGLPYIAMEYLGGGSAQDLVSSGPLDASAVAHLGAAVASALGVAHDAGVVHRDVKPANILLTDSGEPKLGDFGVSSFNGSASLTATLEPSAVTVAYAAPEVLEGQRADVASDLYSLGATLYALTTGHPPFVEDGVGLAPLIGRITNGVAAPLPTTVPRELREVIATAMSREPGDRFADAATMARALAAIEGTDLPATAGRRSPRRPRGRPVRWARPGVALALVGLLIAAAVWTWSAGGSPVRSADTPTSTEPAPVRSGPIEALGMPRAFDRAEFCRIRGEYLSTTNEILGRAYRPFVDAGPTIDMQQRVTTMQAAALSDATDQFLIYGRRLATASYPRGPVGRLQVDLELVLLHHPNVLTREFGLRILERALRLPPSGTFYRTQLAGWWDQWWGFASTEPDVIVADTAFERLEGFAMDLCGGRGVEVTDRNQVAPAVVAAMASSANVTAGPS